MQLDSLLLENGEEVALQGWIDQPIYSTIEFAFNADPTLKLFTYTVSKPVAQSGLVDRDATEADTNIQEAGVMPADSAFLAVAWTYEPFALTPATFGSPPVAVAPVPQLTDLNLRRLQRDCTLSLFVGQSNRPEYQEPFSAVRQSIGPTVVVSGDRAGFRYGTGGYPSVARNQKKWPVPVKIEGNKGVLAADNTRLFYAEFKSWNGVIPDLDQSVRMRITLFGLRKLPLGVTNPGT
jgi:hypothetical protein